MASSTKTLHSTLETGKDKDFAFFSERFEARLHLLRLRSVLLDTETLPATEAEKFSSESTELEEKQSK